MLTAKSPKISQPLSFLTSKHPWTLLTSPFFWAASSSRALSTAWNSSLPAHLPAFWAVASTQPLFIGVPQGSGLGPLLPFICSPSLGTSIHTHVINHMLITSKLLSSPFVYLSTWHHKVFLKTPQTKTHSSDMDNSLGLLFSEWHHSHHLSSSIAKDLGVILDTSSSLCPCSP